MKEVIIILFYTACSSLNFLLAQDNIDRKKVIFESETNGQKIIETFDESIDGYSINSNNAGFSGIEHETIQAINGTGSLKINIGNGSANSFPRIRSKNIGIEYSLGYKYKITFVTKLVRGSVILKTVKFGTSGSTGIISRPNIELSGTQTHSYENIIKSTGDYNPSKIEFQFDSTVSNPRGVLLIDDITVIEMEPFPWDEEIYDPNTGLRTGKVNVDGLIFEIKPNADLTGSDLSGINLRGANLNGANLSNANLTNANLTNAEFFNADLTKTRLKGAQVHETSFRSISGIPLELPSDSFKLIKSNILGPGLNLAGVNLEYSKLNNVLLSNADLSEANLQEADFSGANLEKSNLTGANMSEANLSRANLSGANLSRVNLQRSNVKEANLSGASLRGSDLYESNFSKANLKEVNLHNSYLTRVNLTKADLLKADLTKANITEANMTEADLDETNLSGVDFSGVLLAEANLKGAIIKKTRFVKIIGNPRFLPTDSHRMYGNNIIGPNLDLNGVDFGEAILSGLDLKDVNLMDANLYNADLSNTDLQGANLSRTDLFHAKLMGSNLENTNLSFSDLRNSIITGTNFMNSQLTGADLRGANYLDANFGETNLLDAIYNGNVSGVFLTESEKLQKIIELKSQLSAFQNARMGTVVIDSSDGEVFISFNIEESEDLKTWRATGEKITKIIQLKDGKKFYRFAVDK